MSSEQYASARQGAQPQADDGLHCQECGGGLAHPEDMAWRLADALRRVLYGADDGTTHVERVDVAMEAVETYDRWHAKWSRERSWLLNERDSALDGMHASDAENERLRGALEQASRALDEVVRYFDAAGLPPAGFPLASVVRPAADRARAAQEPQR